MGSWSDGNFDYEWEDQTIEVDYVENPVVYELLGPDGKVIRQWTERPPAGFRRAG